MIVYVLTGNIDYEGAEIISVHATKDLAEEAQSKYKKKYPGHNGFDDYSIGAWEVNGYETPITGISFDDAVQYVRTGKVTPQIEAFLRDVPTIAPKSTGTELDDKPDGSGTCCR